MHMRMHHVFSFAVIVLLCGSASSQQSGSGNLARAARVTVSSQAEGTKAESLNDGDTGTNWRAKEGTLPAQTWIEFNWPAQQHFQEIVIRQTGSPQLSHVDLEIREGDGHWLRLRSIGDSQHLLPRIILAQFETQETNGLRLSNFSGEVGLTEVEVYDRKDPPVVVMGSDLLNHIFGIVTDAFGTEPFSNISVQLQGTAGGKAWHASAQTDSQGIFQTEMPVGLEGDVTATAGVPDGTSVGQTLQAGDLTPGLSRPDQSVPAISLDGTWKFQPDPSADFFRVNFDDSQWKDIAVPSHWMMQGFDSTTGTGGYRRHLQIPADFRGRRIKLLFDGVYSGAEVWLNGIRIGSHEGGFSPFELDVTAAAHTGSDNLLAVLVREKTISSHLDNMSYYANFPLTGIFRPVSLFSLPETHVRQFHVQTVFDPEYRDATLSSDFAVENESGKDVKAKLAFSLHGPNGESVTLENNLIEFRLGPWSRIQRKMDFKISAPQHWEAEHPRLYTLAATLSSGSTSESVSRRFGFRQIQIRGSEFLINGVNVKLHGANHYEMNPLTGRTVTPDLTRKDLEMMKDDNLDAIRTSTFPAVQDLYDDADEMGFYVEEEGPFCWVDDSSDLRYLPIFVQRTAEMLDRDRSHPSVAYWSVGNESTWGPDFEAAHQFVKRVDPTRPSSAGQSATLELDTMHNPISLQRMREREDVKVPIMWDEAMAPFQGDLWGDTREVWLDPGDRDYYIQPLIPVWNAVQASNNVQASIIWAWVDDAFLVPGRDSEYGRGSIVQPLHFLDRIYHMPGRGIVGDAPWGIVDGWRRKKPEFWHVKMLFSPVHMHERDLLGWQSGEPVTFTVDNRYEFSNLSELALNWSIENQHGTLHPDVAPHSTGQITIPVSTQTRPGQYLLLEFLNGKHQLVFTHRMQVGTAPSQPEPPIQSGSLQYVHEPSWLGGPLERFIGDHFEIAFDGANGRIRRALIDRHSVLYQTPKLHVLPIEATLDEFPNFATWRLTKPLDIQAVGREYEVVETGTYRDFSGELRFRISPEGELRVSYDFTYTGTDVRAREVGLQIGVPLWCDRLQWKRRGEWTVYPEDHIGRNEGVTMAHAPGAQIVPPRQSYALDDTPIGTNDFRSTKRNFVFGTLTDKDGYGIGIEAIGSQHLRAKVDTDLIEVNVNDWFGGVAATAWGEWWQNYGTGRELRSDDPNEGVSRNRVSGTIQLFLLSPENSKTWLRKFEGNFGGPEPE